MLIFLYAFQVPLLCLFQFPNLLFLLLYQLFQWFIFQVLTSFLGLKQAGSYPSFGVGIGQVVLDLALTADFNVPNIVLQHVKDCLRVIESILVFFVLQVTHVYLQAIDLEGFLFEQLYYEVFIPPAIVDHFHPQDEVVLLEDFRLFGSVFLYDFPVQHCQDLLLQNRAQDSRGGLLIKKILNRHIYPDQTLIILVRVLQYQSIVDITTHSMSQRVFHQLLARVGDQHRYQFWFVFFSCLQSMAISSSIFILPFLFYQQDYTCSTTLTNQQCKEYVCALPQDQRGAHLQLKHTSLVDRFGDYRCSDGSEVSLMQTIILFGGVIGLLLGSLLKRCCTDRQLIIIVLFLSVVGAGITLLSWSPILAVFGMTIGMAGAFVRMQIGNPITFQVCSQALRTTAINIRNFTFGFGVTLACFLSWLIYHWEVTFLIMVFVPSFICLLMTFLKFEETPMDLVRHKSPSEALQGFSRIAAINDINCDITEQQLANVKAEYEQSQANKRQDSPVSVLDLCRYDSLRELFLISLLVRVFFSFTFFGPQITIQNFALGIYASGTIISVCEIIGNLIAAFFISRCNRKPTIIFFEAIGVAVGLVVILFLSCKDQDQCTTPEMVLQIIGVFIYRMVTTAGFFTFYMVKNEAFPSQIRLIAVQITSFFSRIGVMTLPYVQKALKDKGSIMVPFVIASGLIILLTFVLPQTFGIPPPEMIKELEFELNQEDGYEHQRQE